MKNNTHDTDYIDLIQHHNVGKTRKEPAEEPDYDQEGMIPHN